jgi:hypothetical protein
MQHASSVPRKPDNCTRLAMSRHAPLAVLRMQVLGRYGANGNNNNNNRWWRPSVWVAPAAPPSPSPPPSRPPPPPPSPSPSPSPSPARPTTSYITFNSFGGMDVAGRDIPNASNGQYYTEVCAHVGVVWPCGLWWL